MAKEPTRAEQMARQRMAEWRAKNKQAQREAAAYRAKERAAEKARKAEGEKK